MKKNTIEYIKMPMNAPVEMKHVLFVVDYWLGGSHGVRGSVIRILQAVLSLNAPFHCAVLNLETGISGSGVDESLLLQLPENTALQTLVSPRYPLLVPMLVRHLRNRRPDLLVVHTNPANKAMVWLALRTSRLRCPLVFVDHSGIEQSLHAFRFRSLFLFLARLAYRGCDHLVGVGEALTLGSVKTTGLDPTRTSAIRSPIHLEALRTAAREPVDHPWLDHAELPVIISVSRLDPVHKDLITLIQAFALLDAMHPSRLILVGEGPQEGELRSLVTRMGLEAKVWFTGYTPNPHRLVARATLSVLATLGEGLPNVIVEAMAVGTPVIASDVEYGCRETLDDGRCGVLVPPRNPQALCQAMVELLADPARRAVLAQAATRWVEELAQQDAGAAYVELFTALLSRRGTVSRNEG
ncbi:MAG: glycosyltransferase [Magnetococcales bacterium]|nr:glycosyltransferase [Magnetococcales bacterium]